MAKRFVTSESGALMTIITEEISMTADQSLAKVQDAEEVLARAFCRHDETAQAIYAARNDLEGAKSGHAYIPMSQRETELRAALKTVEGGGSFGLLDVGDVEINLRNLDAHSQRILKIDLMALLRGSIVRI